MSQFKIGWNPFWAWVCSVLDSQDSIKELLNCVLEGQIRRIIQCCSFNHLGRLIENIRRDRNAELLGRLEVDDEIEPGGLLHWQAGRGSTFQDFVHVIRGTPVDIDQVGPNTHLLIGWACSLSHSR